MINKIINFLIPIAIISALFTLVFVGYTVYKILKVKKNTDVAFNGDILYENFDNIGICLSAIGFFSVIMNIAVHIIATLYMYNLLKEQLLIFIVILILASIFKVGSPIATGIVAAILNSNFMLVIYAIIYKLATHIIMVTIPKKIINLMDKNSNGASTLEI